MSSLSETRALVAIDLGAQSCRVSLLRWSQQTPEITLVHRFANGPVQTNDGLRWNLSTILEGIHAGLQQAAQLAPEGVASIAVDGWAVDYVRLLKSGEPAYDPFCYRDLRTEEAERRVHALLPPSQLYSRTGVQILRLNTLYQLYADQIAGRDADLPWLNLPEYISHWLGGTRVSEYTNATHTSLVTLGAPHWCSEIFEKLGLTISLAPEIVPSGTIIGTLRREFGSLRQLAEAKIIVPACHDTASAVAAVPATGDDWAFISSGTWSLVGTVLDTPNASMEARNMNFTNLGGVGRKVCFLKNVNGLWLLQQCMEEWQQILHRLTLPEVISACSALLRPAATIDVDDPEMLLPGNMLTKINKQLERLGQPTFSEEKSSIPAIANLLFYSLAARYADVLSATARISEKKLKRLFVVGGGNQNEFLNRLTAEQTGIEVILGPTEASTIGNFAVQLAALEGDYHSAVGVSSASVAAWAARLSACASGNSSAQGAG